MRDKVFNICRKIIPIICLLITVTLALNVIHSVQRTFSAKENFPENDVSVNILSASLFPLSSGSFAASENGRTVSDEHATLAVTTMNVVYAGIENPLSVSVSGVKPSKVHLSAEGGIINGTTGNYTLSVLANFEQHPFVIITASSKPGGEGKIYGTWKFRVKKLKPEVRLGNILRDWASAKEISEAGSVNVLMSDDFCIEGVSFEVTRYSFMYVPKSGAPVAITEQGKFITPAVNTKLEKLQKGDQIIFYDIKANGPSGEIILASSILITVT